MCCNARLNFKFHAVVIKITTFREKKKIIIQHIQAVAAMTEGENANIKKAAAEE